VDKRFFAACVTAAALSVTGLWSPAAMAAPSTDAVGYQINAKHDGFSAAGVAKPPLTEKWRRALDESVSYPVIANGRVFANGTDAQARGLKGAYDGLKVDQSGNVFTSAAGGLQILSPAGKSLGLIVTETVISNCAWGDDGSTLYFSADHIVCRIKTKTRGDKFPYPGK